MLQTYEMVRKAIEVMYQDKCDIIEHQKVKKPNGSTGFEDVTVMSDVPCRLSFKSAPSTNETDSASAVIQTIEVFLAPEITVKSGSKLVIKHLDSSVEYTNTGVAAVYNTHQQIALDIFKGWS